MSTQNDSQRFLRLPEVSHRTGLGKSTILAWESQARFPKAVRLSPTIRVWLGEDIDSWIRLRHEESRHQSETTAP
jgi:prophage regulatory protein